MHETADHTPAAAINRLFAAQNPTIAATVAPLVERLFAAQADGHAFIYLNDAEQQQCRAAAPFVGGIGSGMPLLQYGNKLFTANTFALEQNLAAEIRRLSVTTAPPDDNGQTAKLLHKWFADPLAIDQQAAAALTLLYRFMLISGGPGTGKTTTVAALLALLCRDHLPRIALAAPTGKAAARMAEALHGAVGRLDDLPAAVKQHLLALQGQTVHRLLNLKPPHMQPEYSREMPLDLAILILDEASMLDSHLLCQLLAALPNGCRVILLGDDQQLPSVGAGAVLSALTHSPPLPLDTLQMLHEMLPENPLDQVSQSHARLRVSRRFDAQSGIGRLAAAVAAGQPEQALSAFVQFPEQLAWYEPNTSAAAVLRQKQQQYWQAVAQGDIQAAFTCQTDAVLLTALREDAQTCNRQYRKLLQKHDGIDTDATWFHGQMLLITRNDPIQKLYNGDIGIVFADEQNRLCACFSGSNGIRRIALSALPEHDDAFALTVHKSQGSEYGEVLFAAPNHHSQTFNRALLYTAVTRAKNHFGYIGSSGSLKTACLNQEQRRSALAAFLYGNHG